MSKEIKKIFRQHTAGAVAFCVVLAIVVVALLAPYVAPRDPYEYDVQRRFEPPSEDYLAGTDNMGRCVLSRVIWGARISLQVGLVAVLIGAFLGLIMGVVAGYSGSTAEAVIMRIVDVGLSFPFILLAILITAFRWWPEQCDDCSGDCPCSQDGTDCPRRHPAGSRDRVY